MIKQLLASQPQTPQKPYGEAFAPSNIALIKYWGKRQSFLNLPMTSSLSISLGEKGAHTRIAPIDAAENLVYLNGILVAETDPFHSRLSHFLNLLKPDATQHYRIDTHVNLPIAAGLASSACGFAALVQAFANLYAWDLPEPILSILCRIGSGSASRSLWQGFVEWHRGERDDGLDSYAEPLPYTMPGLMIGLLIVSTDKKPIGSREAMNITTQTSQLYESWPKQVENDLVKMKRALEQQDFKLMGETAESNAMAMHATMLSAQPSICYFLPETLIAMQKLWALRKEGIPIYFTQDAGPNLKVLTLNGNEHHLSQLKLNWIAPSF
ncbi:MAG: diphosphomevalonate decarboxylase [Gammaproteobacteria bacterium]|nr:diphosphomevalonate decarboxylase [Gammaproteobacteria bacterium]